MQNRSIKQILAETFDKETRAKIFISFLISTVGACLASFPFLVTELTDYISNGDSINIAPILIVILGSFGSWVAATLRQIKKSLGSYEEVEYTEEG